MFYTVCALFIAFNQGAIGYLDGDFWSAIFTAERSGVSVERRTGAQKKLRSGEYLKALRCVVRMREGAEPVESLPFSLSLALVQ